MSDCDPWAVGAIRVRRIRGPREDGMIYWRAVIPDYDGPEPKRWCHREDPDWAAELLGLARGEAHARTNPAPTRMLELLGRYRADLDARVENSELRSSSRDIYRNALRYLTTALADVAIDGLDIDVLRSYCRDRRVGKVRPANLRGRGSPVRGRYEASPQTIASEIDVLRAAWMWARKRGITDRPLEVPKLPKVEPARSKYTPTEAEVEAVIDALRQPWERAATELLLHTGARIGEIAALRWGDVDRRTGMLMLTGKTKTRPFPILEDADAVLLELGPIASPTSRVFPVAFETIRMQLRQSIADACDRLGLPRWSPHGLRRLAVDRLYERFGEVSVIAPLLGQSPVVAMRYYRQPSRESLVAALRAAAMGTGRGKVLRIAAVTTRVTRSRKPATDRDG